MQNSTIYNKPYQQKFSPTTTTTAISLDLHKFSDNNNLATIKATYLNKSHLDQLMEMSPLQFRETDLDKDIPSILREREKDKELYVRDVEKGARTKESATIKEQCFKIRLANTLETLDSASILVQQMYSAQGYPSNPVKKHPMSFTLVAYLNDKAVGTITLGLDTKHEGLAADSLYKDKIDKLRRKGKRLVEFTKLAIDKNPNSKYILGGLLHIAYIYARRIYKYTDVVLEIVPHHERFYKRMLGCQSLGNKRLNTRVNAHVVMLTLDGTHVDKMITLYGGLEDKSKQRTLYSYFFTKKDEEGIMNRLKTGDY